MSAQGGAPAGEVGNTSTPPPVAIATTAAPQMVPPQPGGSGAPSGQGGNSGGGLHWIESLMNGTAHKAAAAGSHPHANSAGGLAGWQQPQGCPPPPGFPSPHFRAPFRYTFQPLTRPGSHSISKRGIEAG